MSTARKYASPAPASEPVTETSTPTVKPSVWQRIKRVVKTAAGKVVSLVKRSAGKVVSLVKRAARRVSFYARVAAFYTASTAKKVGRALRGNWGVVLAAAFVVAALIVAPIPTLVALPVIWVGYQMMNSDSAFVRFFGELYASVGFRLFIEGLFGTLSQRR